MISHHSINYLEFPSTNLLASKQFFSHVFNWQFTDYGPDYTAFETPEMCGGFFTSQLASSTQNGAGLVVLYSQNLEQSESQVRDAGAKIVKPIFDFPGGRRFHFCEPGGCELAIWSDQ